MGAAVEGLERAMGEFEFVQMGRALWKDPEFPNKAKTRPTDIELCSHCNRCAAMILHPDGVRCVEKAPQ